MRHEQAPQRSFGARAFGRVSELVSWIFSRFSLAFDHLWTLVPTTSEMPSSSLGAVMPASTSASALQEALEDAGRLIDLQLQEDRMYPDLSELLMVSAPSE